MKNSLYDFGFTKLAHSYPLGQTSADFVWCLKEMDSQKVLAKCKVKVTGQSAQNHK